ncbi:MAG: glycosyltransferase [Deltaproteobacteria bacterium]|nr:glycosyltransferase [Deltaproteobacteria bacterium]
MNILFLAPQPFFQERGTPMAVRLALEVLSMRFRGTKENNIDLLTYHEGTDVKMPQVNLHRIPKIPFVNSVSPGISLKKIICDIFFLFKAISLVRKRSDQNYDVVHAVEESVFIALLIKWIFKIPYIYDMDSSLAMQVTEKWFLLRPLDPVLSYFEKLAVKNSLAVVPVCDALAVIADRHGSSDTHILRDISMLDLTNLPDQNALRKEVGLKDDDVLILYIGNLEHYQGIDLLVESFAKVTDKSKKAHLVIIGGTEEHVEFYKQKAKNLKIADQTHLLGPRPVNHLSTYLLSADILVSPRTKGNNTPMKIYSYLHSGTAIVATDLPTHTQVMNKEVSVLVPATVRDYADGLLSLVEDEGLRKSLGQKAHQLAENEYTFEVFTQRLNDLYDRIGSKILAEAA